MPKYVHLSFGPGFKYEPVFSVLPTLLILLAVDASGVRFETDPCAARLEAALTELGPELPVDSGWVVQLSGGRLTVVRPDRSTALRRAFAADTSCGETVRASALILERFFRALPKPMTPPSAAASRQPTTPPTVTATQVEHGSPEPAPRGDRQTPTAPPPESAAVTAPRVDRQPSLPTAVTAPRIEQAPPPTTPRIDGQASLAPTGAASQTEQPSPELEPGRAPGSGRQTPPTPPIATASRGERPSSPPGATSRVDADTAPRTDRQASPAATIDPRSSGSPARTAPQVEQPSPRPATGVASGIEQPATGTALRLEQPQSQTGPAPRDDRQSSTGIITRGLVSADLLLGAGTSTGLIAGGSASAHLELADHWRIGLRLGAAAAGRKDVTINGELRGTLETVPLWAAAQGQYCGASAWRLCAGLDLGARFIVITPSGNRLYRTNHAFTATPTVGVVVGVDTVVWRGLLLGARVVGLVPVLSQQALIDGAAPLELGNVVEVVGVLSAGWAFGGHRE